MKRKETERGRERQKKEKSGQWERRERLKKKR